MLASTMYWGETSTHCFMDGLTTGGNVEVLNMHAACIWNQRPLYGTDNIVPSLSIGSTNTNTSLIWSPESHDQVL